MAEEVVEQTLHMTREVKLYQIPPRSATGHISGEWKLSDEVFCGRLRVIAKGELVELRLEDPNTGNLFAMCPVPPDKKDAYVEAVSDSSRNFVIRVEDPASGRHAFLGMGFAERGEAFDFNVALSDHVRHVRREREVTQIQREGGGDEAVASLSSEDARVLYQPHKDLSLKDGQTIRVAVKPGMGGNKSKTAGATGITTGLARLAPPSTTPGLIPPPTGKGIALAPPPTTTRAPGAHPHVPPAPSVASNQGWTDFSEPSPPPADGGWATFE